MIRSTGAIAAVGYGLGILGTAVAVFSFFRYSNYKANLALQNQSIAIQDSNIKALKEQIIILQLNLTKTTESHAQAITSIKALERDVSTYRDLQLDKIATALEANSGFLGKLSESNVAILNTLKSSALIRASEVSADLLTTNGSHVVEDNTKAVQSNTVATNKNTAK